MLWEIAIYMPLGKHLVEEGTNQVTVELYIVANII
jgi:hypothetical protein